MNVGDTLEFAGSRMVRELEVALFWHPGEGDEIAYVQVHRGKQGFNIPLEFIESAIAAGIAKIRPKDEVVDPPAKDYHRPITLHRGNF